MQPISNQRVDSFIEPAWERRHEVGFFKSISLTIWQILFHPTETFSRFQWDGGYWNPIFLNLLVCGASTLLWGPHLLTIDPSLAAVCIALFSMIMVGFFSIVYLYLFSATVHVLLTVCRIGTCSYQSTFRVVSYTTAAIRPLLILLGISICYFLPRMISTPIQTPLWILLMIWQGYCIVVGLRKAISAPFWKPLLIVAVTMFLAYGCDEMTSIRNPIGRKIWNDLYRCFTGNDLWSESARSSPPIKSPSIPYSR